MTPSLFKIAPDREVIRAVENKMLRKERGESGKRLLTEEECLIYADELERRGHLKGAEFFRDKTKT
jgi:hypothetical protein